MAALLLVDGGHHDLGQRLAHLDVDLAAQGEHHGGDFLCHVHTGLEVGVDAGLVGLRPAVEVDALQLASEVVVELVAHKRGKRGEQVGHGHQASVERVISRTLVVAHVLAPEAFAVEAHIPVGEFVVDKLLDEASGARGIIAVKFAGHTLDERVETRDDPAVDLGSVGAKLGVLGIVAIHVGVEGEEAVCVVERAEEAAAALIDAILVKLEVVPRFGVGHHIEADGVGAILFDHLKGWDDIAHVL